MTQANCSPNDIYILLTIIEVEDNIPSFISHSPQCLVLSAIWCYISQLDKYFHWMCLHVRINIRATPVGFNTFPKMHLVVTTECWHYGHVPATFGHTWWHCPIICKLWQVIQREMHIILGFVVPLAIKFVLLHTFQKALSLMPVMAQSLVEHGGELPWLYTTVTNWHCCVKPSPCPTRILKEVFGLLVRNNNAQESKLQRACKMQFNSQSKRR